MNDHEEEIKLLKAELDLLKKELAENKENDNKRHEEIKEIQQEHHRDNLFWNKIGALGTPITLLLPLIPYFFRKFNQSSAKEKNKDKSLEKKLDKIIKLLEQKEPINKSVERQGIDWGKEKLT